MKRSPLQLIKALWLYRRTFIAVLFPLLFLPMIVIDGENDIGDPGCAERNECEYSSAKVARFSYSLLIMGSYWISECIPIAATALLPYIFYPLFGIQTAADVAKNYMKNTTLLLLGGLTVAVAIESSNLHKRIALGTLKIIGCSPRRIMTGFMLISWFLSMWIANTATTAMMIPIALAVIEELHKNDVVEGGIANVAYKNDTNTAGVEQVNKISVTEGDDNGIEMNADGNEADLEQLNKTNCDNENETNNQNEIKKAKLSMIEKGIILCVPYASSVGGTATLTGTAPNLVLQTYWEEHYIEAPYSLNYVEWLGYNVLCSAVMLVLILFYMQLWYLGCGCTDTDNAHQTKIKKVIDNAWGGLSKISQEEIIVLIAFIVLVLSWFFRDPGFIPGWVELFPEPRFISDGVPSLVIAILLFIIPAEKTGLICGKLENGPSRAVLNWKLLEAKMSWGVLLLIGGGFAMADASKVSGFSTWFATGLGTLVEHMEVYAISIVVTILAALFTEICSNTAATALLVPLLAELSTTLCINPLYLLLPATLACSLSFMLPAATPPNAIAFGSGKLAVIDMIKSGVIANIIGIVVVNGMLYTWGDFYFELGDQNYLNWTDTKHCDL